MNRILTKVLEQRKGHYCHVLEIGSVYELETVIGTLYQEFEDEYYIEEIIDFLDSLQVYYFPADHIEQEVCDTEEEAIYNFNIANYITELI